MPGARPSLRRSWKATAITAPKPPTPDRDEGDGSDRPRRTRPRTLRAGGHSGRGRDFPLPAASTWRRSDLRRGTRRTTASIATIATRYLVPGASRAASERPWTPYARHAPQARRPGGDSVGPAFPASSSPQYSPQRFGGRPDNFPGSRDLCARLPAASAQLRSRLRRDGRRASASVTPIMIPNSCRKRGENHSIALGRRTPEPPRSCGNPAGTPAAGFDDRSRRRRIRGGEPTASPSNVPASEPAAPFVPRRFSDRGPALDDSKG